MYEFVDSGKKAVQSEEFLPAEALNFNGQWREGKSEGVWIEREIDGYRTLHVSGRELLECEIDDYENGNKNGSQYRGKRYPARTITVTYQLIAEDDVKFRDAYNKLNKLLDAANAKLIFADEPDKYFIGTKAGNSEVPPGTNRVTGEIEFYCTDPFKYSTVEKVFPATMINGIMKAIINNEGTESVPVDYTITHSSENGFVGIVSGHGDGAIELGDIKELDGETKEMSEYLLDYNDYLDYDAMTREEGVFCDSEYGITEGRFGQFSDEEKSWLELATIGTGGSWHGAATTIDLPVDSSGEVGAANFTLQAKVWFQPTDIAQLGIIEYALADEDGEHLMSVRIAKWEPNRETAYLLLHIAGKKVAEIAFNPFSSQLMTQDTGEFYMMKSGSELKFHFGEIYSFVCPELEEKKAKTVSVFIGQRENYALVERMRLQYLHFRKDRVEKWQDIPNRYQSGDRIYIEGNTSKVYVNGNQAAGDIVKGSCFFHVRPGETEVQFFFSEFCTNPPVITAKIREAYL